MSLRRLSLHAANAWSCPLLASIDQGEQRKREANADVFFTAMVNLTADLVFVSPLILLCRHVILPAVAARMLHRPLARRVALLNEGSAALKERRTVRGHHHAEDSSAGPYSGGTVADHSNPALAAISVLRAKKVFLKALTHSTRDRAAGGGHRLRLRWSRERRRQQPYRSSRFGQRRRGRRDGGRSFGARPMV